MDTEEQNINVLHIGCGDYSLAASVTRFGDLLDFGQLFKAFGYN